MTVFHCFSHFYAKEQIAPATLRSIALFYRATGAISSWKRANRNFALLLTKTSDSHEKPKSEFPTLKYLYYFVIGKKCPNSTGIYCMYYNEINIFHVYVICRSDPCLTSTVTDFLCRYDKCLITCKMSV